MSKLSFGKAIEYKVASEMLREGFEVYLPIVDDHGVDMVVKTPGGNIVKIQVKALSKASAEGLFAGISHSHRSDFYFVFYLETYNTMWIFKSADFVKYATVNKKGKNVGKYSINVRSKTLLGLSVSDYCSIV